MQLRLVNIQVPENLLRRSLPSLGTNTCDILSTVSRPSTLVCGVVEIPTHVGGRCIAAQGQPAHEVFRDSW